MGVLLKLMTSQEGGRFLPLEAGSPLQQWLDGSFTKITVSVNSEQELLDLQAKAEAAGLLNYLITDNGKTEFHGVPTRTALAIGPARDEDLKPLTGHLPLL